MAHALLALTLIFTLWLPATGCAAEAMETQLNARQSELFRSWFLRIVAEELRRGPSPRWVHRDCASLIRFAAGETLRSHDEKWLKASGMSASPLPPELTLTPEQQLLRNRWKTYEGNYQAYVSAIGLVQGNTVFVSRNILLARPGDLLFFDQGDDQHLMIWINDGVAYHRGKILPGDNGLRAVSIEQLLNWKDSRWQPRPENSNFVGVYRFSFLSR
ncbi:MAG: DUF1175 family protein [Pseudomonadota bacterium]